MQGRRRIAGVAAVPVDLARPRATLEAMQAFGPTLTAMVGGLKLPDRAREGLLKFVSGEANSMGDASLSAFSGFLGRETGAQLIGAHEIAPELLAPEGRIGGPEPTEELLATGAWALELARHAGQLDLGQAVVVSGRRVSAVEGSAGTDALLRRVRLCRRRGLVADGQSPLVFAKAAKPGQPHAVDLPAIGPVTVKNARKAGVALIAVQAGASLLVERRKLAAAADAARLPVVGIAVRD